MVNTKKTNKQSEYNCICRNKVIHFQKQLVPARPAEPAPKNFEWWSRSLKFGFPFNTHSLWSKPVVQIMQWVLVLNGTNRFGAGARNLCFDSTALPTTANLATGFLSASFFKAGCKLVSLVVWGFHRSSSFQDDCDIYYACAVLGRNLLSNIFRGKLQ